MTDNIFDGFKKNNLDNKIECIIASHIEKHNIAFQQYHNRRIPDNSQINSCLMYLNHINPVKVSHPTLEIMIIRLICIQITI
jgi:hypothetical protein